MYLVSVDATFLETTPFYPSPIHTSEGEDDDLLVYTIASPHPASIKPPITPAYTRRQNPLVMSPTLAVSTLDPVPSDDFPIALCKGKRQCVHSISSFCTYNHLSSHSCSFIASLDSISLPNNVPKTLSHPGRRSVMIEEMDALNDNGTCDLVQLPIRKKAIGCCWVFAVKVNPDGSVARLKTHLVAKGYIPRPMGWIILITSPQLPRCLLFSYL